MNLRSRRQIILPVGSGCYYLATRYSSHFKTLLDPLYGIPWTKKAYYHDFSPSSTFRYVEGCFRPVSSFSESLRILRTTPSHFHSLLGLSSSHFRALLPLRPFHAMQPATQLQRTITQSFINSKRENVQLLSPPDTVQL